MCPRHAACRVSRCRSLWPIAHAVSSSRGSNTKTDLAPLVAHHKSSERKWACRAAFMNAVYQIPTCSRLHASHDRDARSLATSTSWLISLLTTYPTPQLSAYSWVLPNDHPLLIPRGASFAWDSLRFGFRYEKAKRPFHSWRRQVVSVDKVADASEERIVLARVGVEYVGRRHPTISRVGHMLTQLSADGRRPLEPPVDVSSCAHTNNHFAGRFV